MYYLLNISVNKGAWMILFTQLTFGLATYSNYALEMQVAAGTHSFNKDAGILYLINKNTQCN